MRFHNSSIAGNAPCITIWHSVEFAVLNGGRVEQRETPIDREALGGAAQWFLVVAGLVYGIGFLIVFTFLDRFGIRVEGTDLFKTRYIYVGLLFLLFPAFVGLPVVALVYLRGLLKKSQSTKQSDFQVYVPAVVLVLNMLLVFGVFVAFARPGGAMHLIPVIFIATFLGTSAIRWGEQFIRIEVLPKYTNRARWFLCVAVVVGLDYYTLQDLFPLLAEMIASGGYVFIAFVLLIWYAAWRTAKRLGSVKDAGPRRALLAASSGIIAALYYLSALAFALRVYCYIPANKAGGDFMTMPRATLHFSESSVSAAPRHIMSDDKQDGLKSRPVMILEMTNTSVFIVDPSQ